MTELRKKDQMLEDAGYKYSLKRDIYVNREKKKVFSIEFVEDNTPEDLERHILEDRPGRDWEFIFNKDPSPSVKRELTALLDA